MKVIRTVIDKERKKENTNLFASNGEDGVSSVVIFGKLREELTLFNCEIIK